MTKLGIIGAMEQEVETLLGLMENKQETEKAVLDVLQLALQRVALAEAIGYGDLLCAGLEEGGGFRHGVAVLLADHAEVRSALQKIKVCSKSQIKLLMLVAVPASVPMAMV